MKDLLPSPRLFRFDPFELDPQSGELRKRGANVKLQKQPADLLRILLERPGEVVTREELRKRLWPGKTFGDFDVGLNKAVRRLREALDDSAQDPRYIETLPQHGYRFIAPVTETGPSHRRCGAPLYAVLTAGHEPPIASRRVWRRVTLYRMAAALAVVAVVAVLS